MADKHEEVGVTTAPTDTPQTSGDVKDYETHPGDLGLPKTWMYRERHLGKFAIPWFASPKVQLGLVAFVCFLCPGMFNALGGLGGGGKTDATLADNMVEFPHSFPPERYC